MATITDIPMQLAWLTYGAVKSAPLSLLALLALTSMLAVISMIYLALFILAPTPRPPHPSEKKYVSTTDSETQSRLPCWHDAWLRGLEKNIHEPDAIDNAEVFMSVVIPAYNEEARLEVMLEEAIEYLDVEYGSSKSTSLVGKTNGHTAKQPIVSSPTRKRRENRTSNTDSARDYEILIINDGSHDKTVEVALRVATKHRLGDNLRVVTLVENRGKGGAVTHGFRHVRGQYAVFADADGASRFSDLGKLVEACDRVTDSAGRGVAVGSRAHMVGSEAVIQRSALRNALMHGFHLLLRFMTPPATSRIKDTQCGFKLFSRSALPHIIPYMHAEGWIFDVEMLMLAESAPSVDDESGPGIRVAEVAIGWHEIGGSKLNVIWDSLGMAYGLALLRLSWALGVYRRK